ncbi:MAG: CysB family HTH-type transcriptional regulator [Rhodocyclaceae bacterium]|nr:CysB family HTH-type transcriptional regulator [Rhodocyclaceae bacterium]
MNFQQLRIIREAVHRDFNLTEVANALYTSQSGVSKHIKDLEDELGIELFVRRGKRLLGLTEPGKELATIVERMLMDASNVKRLAEQFANRDSGKLTVATTHTQARYALPKVVAQFKSAFPKVHLALHQSSPEEIVSLLKSGEADIGIATEALADVPELASFTWYDWRHSLVVPKGHALAEKTAITLAELAEFPLITYHGGFTGRGQIDRAFAAAGLVPDIVMSALDADVIKTYVELGLGVGIIASVAFHPKKDEGLVRLDGPDAFATNTTRIAIRKGHYLRGFAYRFVELCSPSISETVVRESTAPSSDSDL